MEYTYVNRIRDHLNKIAKIFVIQSLVMNIINHGISIWGTTNSTQIERVQRLQNFVAKVALGRAAKRGHVTPFLKELGWLKISQKHILEKAVIIYNLMNKYPPDWLFPLHTVRGMYARRTNTRQTEQIPSGYTHPVEQPLLRHKTRHLLNYIQKASKKTHLR